MSDSLQPHGLYTPWNSPGQNYWNGYPFPSPGDLPTQGSNPGLPHCRWIIYQLSHKGSPRIMEWVAYPFSSGSSQLRNRTGVSYIAGRFVTSWATREAHGCIRAVLLSFHYTAVVLYFLFPDGHLNFLDHFFFFFPSLSFITSLLSSQNWSVFITITSSSYLPFQFFKGQVLFWLFG